MKFSVCFLSIGIFLSQSFYFERDTSLEGYNVLAKFFDFEYGITISEALKIVEKTPYLSIDKTINKKGYYGGKDSVWYLNDYFYKNWIAYNSDSLPLNMIRIIPESKTLPDNPSGLRYITENRVTFCNDKLFHMEKTFVYKAFQKNTVKEDFEKVKKYFSKLFPFYSEVVTLEDSKTKEYVGYTLSLFKSIKEKSNSYFPEGEFIRLAVEDSDDEKIWFTVEYVNTHDVVVDLREY